MDFSTHIMLHNAETINRKNPHVVGNFSETYKSKMTWIPWNDINEIKFEEITITRQIGLLVSGYNVIKTPVKLDQEIEINGPCQQLQTVAPIVQLWGYGYYHFLIEQIPKMLRICKISSDIPILIYYQLFHPAINMSFIPTVLAAFGIKNPIINYHPSVVYLITEAIQTTEIMCGIPSPYDIKLLREVAKTISPPIKKNIGILIKRSGRSLRSLANHDIILADLIKAKPYIQWHVFDTMSFIDTIKLFSQASIVVGPHGAGLTNIVWCDNNIDVVEIGSYIEPNICYWHISELLGNRHIIITSDQDSDGRFTINSDAIITSIKN